MSKTITIEERLNKLEERVKKLERKAGNHELPKENDPLFDEAKSIVSLFDMASASLLQRRLMIGYSRAARLLDDLGKAGIVGPAKGSAPRKVLKKS